MPNLHLETQGGYEVDLWQAQEDRDERAGNINPAETPTFDSDEAYLTGLTEQHTATVSGLATAHRLARQPDFSDDPVTALAEWVQRVMAIHNGQQGPGLTLTHDLRGYERTVVLTSFGWTRTGGEPFDLEWDLEYRIGEGVMTTAAPDPNPATPSSTWALDGRDLEHPIQYREAKQQPFETAEMAFAESAEENIQRDTGGPIRRVIINGRHTGSFAERSAFDEHFRSLIGQDQIVSYESAFPGHTLDVMVDRFEGVLEAGRTRVGEYTLELIEGTN